MDWFEVSKVGLAKLLDKRGKAFALYELIQNAWDTSATDVRVSIGVIDSRPLATIRVEDNDPNGFHTLTHAFTLFAESAKKGDPEKRGRFNLGEKLVLALCTEAIISSTTGTVRFDSDGRHQSRKRTSEGSVFEGQMRMTREEYADVLRSLALLIPPRNVVTTINGTVLPHNEPIVTFDCKLPTEIADSEGFIRRSARKTTVSVHEVRTGETAMLYEMGIPVVETGDRWHINVHQKIPLNIDRDNVTPAYLRELRTYVLNNTFALLSPEDATTAWVRDASADERVIPAAIEKVLTDRFGSKRVIYDPSDPEGTKRAVAQGYTVISGGALSAGEWSNVRASGAALPAGQVTPSPKPYHPDGEPLTLIPPEKWTPGMKNIATFARELGRQILHRDVTVTIANDPHWGFNATYGPGRLVFNAGSLGHAWFDRGRRDREVLRLLIHELAHDMASDHLSREYHEALCSVGADLARLALDEECLFDDVA